MIIEIQQYAAGSNLSYKCFRGGEEICDVMSPAEAGQRFFYFHFFREQKEIQMRYTPRDKTHGKDFRTRHAKWLYQNQQRIGSIVSRKEYGAFDVDFRGRKLTVYNAEFGDVCCQIVLDEAGNVVAEIKRHLRPYRQKDHYTAFCNDEELGELMCVLAVHIDFVEYRETYGGEPVGTSGCIGASQYYDEEFIKRIVAAEGYDLEKEPDPVAEQIEWNHSQEAVQKKTRDRKARETAIGIALLIIIILMVSTILK